MLIESKFKNYELFVPGFSSMRDDFVVIPLCARKCREQNRVPVNHGHVKQPCLAFEPYGFFVWEAFALLKTIQRRSMESVPQSSSVAMVSISHNKTFQRIVEQPGLRPEASIGCTAHAVLGADEPAGSISLHYI